MKAAADVGIVLTAQTAHTKTINVCGEMHDLTVHAEFPFDSTRKRMSLVIEAGGRYSLLTKASQVANHSGCTVRSCI